MTSCHNIPQLALVFIIGIARNADQLDAVGIAQRAAKIPAVLPNQRFCRVRFFDMQSAPRLLADLFAVQPGRHDPLAGALVQIVHLFLRLGKGKADLLGGQVRRVAVQRFHNAGDKTVGRCAAGGGGCTDLPLQGLFVGVGVDVRLLQKTKRHAATVQFFIQGAPLVGTAAHAGNTVKHNGIPRLYTVQQLVQFPPSLAGRSGIDLTDDMRRWVGGGNVAHLALDILARRGNTAIAIDLHNGSTSDVRLI